MSGKRAARPKRLAVWQGADSLSCTHAPAAVRSSLRQMESAFYTLLVDCGADIPLAFSPLLETHITRRMEEVKATADAALRQMAMARADLVRETRQLVAACRGSKVVSMLTHSLSWFRSVLCCSM